MNSRDFLKKVVVIGVVFQLALGQGLFASTTDKDFYLDDNDAHSPLVIMRDQGEKTFTLQKVNGGVAELINNEGSIDFKPNNDPDDYLRMLITEHLPSIMWVGAAIDNAPGIRISANGNTGQLQYRDENSATWVSFDSIAGEFANGGELGTAARTLGNTDGYALGFLTDGATRLHIKSDGDIGIGTTTPTAKVDVSGKIKTTNFQMTGGSPSSGDVLTSSDALGNATWNNIVSATNYKGTHQATTDPDPTSSTLGDAWIISEAGSVGGQAVLIGDWIIWNGATWDVVSSPSTVASVNGDLGTVIVDELKFALAETTKIIAADTYLSFLNDNAETMRLITGGKVGIGTTAPDKLLEINGATGGNIRLTYNDADGTATNYTDLQVGSDGDLTITTVDSDGTAGDIALMPNGNVGIGTTAPGSKLDVKGTLRLSGATSGYVGLAPVAATTSYTLTLPAAAPASSMVMVSDTSGNLSWTGVISNIIPNDNASALLIEDDDTGADYLKIDTAVTGGEFMYFGNAATNPAFRFLGNGDVTVGGDLTVTGNEITFGLGEKIDNLTNGTVKVAVPTNGYLQVVAGNLKVGAPTVDNITVNGGDVTIADDVEIDGDLWVEGTFSSPSDIRLKENIETLSGVLTKINQIRGVRYEFKDQEKYASGPQIGLIAQELQSVFPELVREGANGYLAVNYTQVSAVLVQAVKEQQQQIDDLNQKLDSQQEQIDMLLRSMGGVRELIID